MKIFYRSEKLDIPRMDYAVKNNKPQINGETLDSDNTEEIKVTWFGNQAAYDAIPTKDPYTFYIIEDGVITTVVYNYNLLTNIPTIDGIPVVGNITASDFNVYEINEIDNMIATITKSVSVVTSKPTHPAKNTIYYVGPDSHGVYKVYAYNNIGTEIDMGYTHRSAYYGGTAININKSLEEILVKYDNDSIKLNSNGEFALQDFSGASETTHGKKGLAIKPGLGKNNSYLRGDSQWFDLLNAVYPIGSIYTSVLASPPRIGGTWIKLQENVCLWNTYSGGGDTIPSFAPFAQCEDVPDHVHMLQNSGSHAHLLYWSAGIVRTNDPSHWQASGGWMHSPADRDKMDDQKKFTESAGIHTHELLESTIDRPKAKISGVYTSTISYVQPPAIAVTSWQRIA